MRRNLLILLVAAEYFKKPSSRWISKINLKIYKAIIYRFGQTCIHFVIGIQLSDLKKKASDRFIARQPPVSRTRLQDSLSAALKKQTNKKTNKNEKQTHFEKEKAEVFY